jgi:sirohydrochlorin ferrochelatase
MDAGTIVFGADGSVPGIVRAAESAKAFLEARGRRNVRIAYYKGSDEEPFSVMSGMYSNGVDTFCILPLAIAEGRMTVKLMPQSLHLPDNSGSWTMVGSHDVATRFSTALGRDSRMASAIAARLGEPMEDTGVLVLSRGSDLTQSRKTAEWYAGKLHDAGWKTAAAFLHHGITASEASQKLSSAGCRRIVVLPLMVASDTASAVEAVNSIRTEKEVLEPVALWDAFLEILDSKVPEKWRSSCGLEDELGHDGVHLLDHRIGHLGDLAVGIHEGDVTLLDCGLDHGFRYDVGVVVSVEIDCELAHLEGDNTNSI